MDKQKIQSQLIDIICKEAKISKDALLQNPSLDQISSLARVEILFEIEEVFDIEISNEEVENMHSLESTTQLIHAKLQDQAS